MRAVCEYEVLTVVDSAMQNRLDVALGEVVRPRHLNSVSAAINVVRERPVRAILIGHTAQAPATTDDVGRLARMCSGLLILVLGDWAPDFSDALLRFGRYGLRDVVDFSTRDGLVRLRTLLTHPEWSVAMRIEPYLQLGLKTSSREMQFIMNHLVRAAPIITTAHELAADLGVVPSSLMSRFFRAGLPSPKAYLALIRLLYAFGILEDANVSLAQAAVRLNYSSSQSFMRHVRDQLGMSGREFRARYSFEALSVSRTLSIGQPIQARHGLHPRSFILSC